MVFYLNDWKNSGIDGMKKDFNIDDSYLKDVEILLASYTYRLAGKRPRPTQNKTGERNLNTQQILKEPNGQGALDRLVRHIHFHRKKGRWVYFAISRWQPFRLFQHGGWIRFNLAWLYRFGYEIPRQRGWRWD